jgi:hypothetical protein
MARGNIIGTLSFSVSFTIALLVPLMLVGKEKAAPMAVKGEKLFTQFSLYYEKGHHITTNYRVGILVPINTEVEFVKANKKTITVKIPGYDVEVEFINVKDYSGEAVEGIFSRTFGREPVDLTGFTAAEQSAIRLGVVAIGMRKDAVIKAMGYPPRHKTPALSINQWRYWKSRFDTVLVSFEDDKVISITD